MPSPEDMLQELTAANRDAYERRNGEPITNPASFDLAFRKRKLADEEAKPGSIQRAYENLTGTGARRNAAASSTPVTELDYTGGLAATMLASIDHETGEREWTDDEIIEKLTEADGVSDFVARRALEAAKPWAARELADRASRRAARVKLAELEAAPKVDRPAIPRLAVATPTPPPVADDDLDDDAIWNQEPA